MRIWCVSVKDLDDQRLLGERRELSAMITIILRAEKRGGFTKHGWGGISSYYRDRFRFVEKRYNDQIKELKYRRFRPVKIRNFRQIYTEFPALKETSKRSGWKQGGKWYRSIAKAKADLAARWDSGISRAGGVNKPRWTRRGPPDWYTPKKYIREDDIRFNPKYRKKGSMNFRKVIERVAQFEKIARANPYHEIADALETFGVNLNFDPRELKKMFRKLAMKYHPDRNPGDAEAARKMAKYSSAYSVLTGSKYKKLIKSLRAKGIITPRKIRVFGTFRGKRQQASGIHPDIVKLKNIYSHLVSYNLDPKLQKRIIQFLRGLSSATDPTEQEIKKAQKLYAVARRSSARGSISPPSIFLAIYLLLRFSPIILPILLRISRAVYKYILKLLKAARRKFGKGMKKIKKKIRWMKKKLSKRPPEEQRAVADAGKLAAKKLNIRKVPVTI